MLKIKFHLLAFFLISFFTYSQNFSINGKVSDLSGEALKYATVQAFLFKTERLLSYGITDENGEYSLHVSQSFDTLLLRTGFLGYKTEEFLIVYNKTNKIVHNSILEKSDINLSEVIVNADFPDLVEKNDTIIFNLEKLLDGREEKLIDIIKKLPGLHIDENKKINYQGKQLDNILIDGEEFFGKQHQIATDNLSADIIKGIELLKEYNNFSSFPNFETKNATAINIKVKDEFKQKINGDASASLGYESRYSNHLNLFKFNKTANNSLIADFNDINNNGISIDDYIELDSGVGKENFAGEIVENEVPEFLLKENDVKTKNISFGAFNTSLKLNESLKLTGYSIINKVKQTEEINSTQIFFSKKNDTLLNNFDKKGFLLFSTNRYKLDYKPSKDLFLGYELVVNFNEDEKNSFVESVEQNAETLIEENKGQKNLKLSQNLNFKTKLNDNVLFDSSFFHEYIEDKNVISVGSNDILFNTNNLLVSQNYTQLANNAGFYFKIKKKLRKDFLSFRGGSSMMYNKFISDNNADIDFLKETSSFNKIESYIGVDFQKNEKLSYAIGIDLVSNHFFETNTDLYFFLPTFRLSLPLNEKTIFNVSYSRTRKSPTQLQSLTNKYVLDFQTIVSNNDVRIDEIIPEDKFGIGYSYFDLNSGFNTNITGSYSVKKNSIGFNTLFNESFSEFQNTFIPKEESLVFILFAQKKFKKFPWNFNFSAFYLNNISTTFVENIKNDVQTNIIKLNMNMSSNFKKENFGVQFGVKYSMSEFFLEQAENENRLITFIPNANFESILIKKFRLNINFGFQNYIAQDVNRRIFNISPILKCQTNDKSKFEFNFTGGNILNVNENELLKIGSSANSFREEVFASLPGYLLFGLNYKF